MFDIGTALGVVLLTCGAWLAGGAAAALLTAGVGIWVTAVAATVVSLWKR